MNEVEELYSLAEVEKCEHGHCDWSCAHPSHKCNNECPNWEVEKVYYPPFTAEKQLEIVKFLLHKGVYYDTDGDTYWFHYTDEIENATYRPFEEAIAEFINILWQDLTDAEKQQIKNILESEVRE